MHLEVSLLEVRRRIKHVVGKLQSKVDQLGVLLRVALLKKKLNSSLAHELKVIKACLFQELPVREINAAAIVKQVHELGVKHQPEHLANRLDEEPRLLIGLTKPLR